MGRWNSRWRRVRRLSRSSRSLPVRTTPRSGIGFAPRPGRLPRCMRRGVRVKRRLGGGGGLGGEVAPGGARQHLLGSGEEGGGFEVGVQVWEVRKGGEWGWWG